MRGKNTRAVVSALHLALVNFENVPSGGEALYGGRECRDLLGRWKESTELDQPNVPAISLFYCQHSIKKHQILRGCINMGQELMSAPVRGKKNRWKQSKRWRTASPAVFNSSKSRVWIVITSRNTAKCVIYYGHFSQDYNNVLCITNTLHK